MYAFWRYDLFPHMLGGEVVGGPDGSGRVQVQGYATKVRDGVYRGGWVAPVFLVDVETGSELWRKIDELRAKKRRAQAELDAEFRAELRKLCPSRLAKGIPQLAKKGE